ncbi:MAG: lipoprotein-releasing system ATP-binding protein LolD [Desulfuromonas sp.]|nr:MAG: lipoprotein-releasing system ATP-binding protein LolD [Desulfuromonas sp.]
MSDKQPPLVWFRDVTRSYGKGDVEVAALKNVDLAIASGEFVSVWGPSGSGKSTLCNLIGGIDLPTSGAVQINGEELAKLPDAQQSSHRNRSVGFIFQNFNLIGVLTALENVLLPLTLRGAETSRARQEALTLLDELGLAAEANRLPDKLSGGQQQRVAIARALMTKPPLVVADEPTANLDSENAEKIVTLMRHFNRSVGTTFVFSTHDDRLLDKVDRRIHLRDGQITDDVTVAPFSNSSEAP